MVNCTNVISNKKTRSNHWYDGIYDSYDKVTDYVGGQSKSTLISILNLFPMSPNAPFTVALLKHYVEGGGTEIKLSDLGEMPKAWKDFIVKETGGREGKYNINPYNSDIFDLTYSIGHFDVTVTKTPTTQKRYEISDFYVFGYKKNDIHQKGQHGFPVPFEDLSDDVLSIASDLLPEETYCNPGGYPEKWEIRRVKSKTILIIPQEFLANHGTPFKVFGSFTQ